MVLKYLKENGIHRTKSGIMLGLSETKDEVIEAMQELREVDVDILTLGQYLQPTTKHLPVVEFIKPEVFEELKEIGLEMGFRYLESGPLVRSSYHAEKHLYNKVQALFLTFRNRILHEKRITIRLSRHSLNRRHYNFNT